MRSFTFFRRVAFLFFTAFVLQTMISGPMALAQTEGFFSDVSRTHPDYTAIDFLAARQVIQGYDDQTFRSGERVTRAAALKILLEGSGVLLDIPFNGDLFPDITDPEEWSTPYIMKAESLGIVSGNEPEGTFDAAESVNLATFSKMLLNTNQIEVNLSEGEEIVPGIDMNQWYGPFLNKIILFGIWSPTSIDPAQPLTRGDVVRMMYVMMLITNGDDTQFLLDRTQAEMAQVGFYLTNDDLFAAKTTSRRAYNLTQQAYKNLSDNSTVLGVAKLALAYDLLVDMIIVSLEGDLTLAQEKGNLVMMKATEAWQANNNTQPLGAYLKEQARAVAAENGLQLTE